MKASEFLNKTKEEIQTQLNILLNNDKMKGDSDSLSAQIFLAQALLSNDIVFKQAASSKEGRLQLLTLAEVLKSINGVLRIADEKNLTDEETNQEIMNKLPTATLNAQAKAIEYDDLEEDVAGASIYEVKDFCKQTIVTMLSNTDKNFDEEDKELAGEIFDKLFDETIVEMGYENKTSFTDDEMNSVFMRIGNKIKQEDFEIEDYVDDEDEDDNILN